MKRKNYERCLIIVLLVISFMLLIKFEIISAPLTIFIWSLITFYFINYWLYEEKRMGYFIILPIFVIDILAIQFLLSIIGWSFGIEIFHGSWAIIFAWPSLLAGITTTLYLIFMLDESMKDDIKNWLRFKKSNPKGQMIYERDDRT